ncbi:mucin-2-like [Seriola lalandi dorsalis]|uniref:mucin-2-like n=1 Tax=Seriola lalandi dorsalis TaxID=1841481 RepID=UPI000C6FAFCD|nr:mucin-2-like [Seriola lalandi dorsalis]
MGWRRVSLCFLALSVAIVTDVQARLVRNHVNSICSTWGRGHFKTFDGDIYQFPGMCEYNLASDCHETYQEFSVHVRRKEEDGNPIVSYVVVTINDLSFHLSKNLVNVNDELVKLPFYQGGVQVERNAVYIKLQSKVGLTVMWYLGDSVMVELDRDYANRTCGLCGDFNGVAVNEFIHNGRKISPIEFGTKQKVHLPNDDCEDPYEEEDDSREARSVPDSCKQFQTTCDQMLHSESWSSCTKLIDPEPYIQTCVQDMCGCPNTTNDFCVCSTLSEFSRECSHAGGQPPNWRTHQFCAKKCLHNMVYEESSSPCIETCKNQGTSSMCEHHRLDGCVCPPGTVFDDISNRGCIAQSKCQCYHKKIYNPGEVYRQDQDECTCLKGGWVCKSLETPATCAVEEGSHVTTFDGKTYNFHGDCYYTLAKVESKDDASPKFTIMVQLVPCANQEFDTCLKTLKILLNNDRNNVLMFTSDGTVKQNTQPISLPYHSGDINIFQASSFHILLQTTFGLQIQIQQVPLMQVYVRLDQSYRAKTRGLCGDYNMVLSDDMKTPQGIVEGTAVTFANSWKSKVTCEDREERLEDPCSLSMDNELYAKHWCALLQNPNSTFAQCSSVVDPEMYYKRCIYASCNCEKNEACLCAVLSSYARACASKGVFLKDWRENVCDKYSKSCPPSQTFSYKHQRCQLTCRSLGSKQQSCTSDFLPVDGCSCSEGFYLNEKGICVPMAKCPCYHNEEYIRPGKSISIKDEHCVCTNGMLHCRSWRTHSSTCSSPKVFFNCSTAGTAELGVQCARTCLNLDSNDCASTECESGCQCPSGLLDDGKGSCVKEKDCPCQHNGHLYAPGKVIRNKCNNCTCKSGKWDCTKKKCQGTCIIYGSGHYNTFDQQTYAFQGHCAYIAVKNKCGNKTAQDTFGVITENVPCGSTGTTCSKTVRIQLGRKEIKLSKGKYEEEDLEHGTHVPYKIRTTGLYLVIESAIGLTVIWDRRTTVYIHLEPGHSGEVCGLCGDFDGNGQNDFTTQGQLVVSNPIEFANSWKVSSTCPDVEMNGDPCVANPNRHHWAKMMCSIITGKTFKDCRQKVDHLPFYENCVKDSCACDTGGDCECFCTAVAAYAQACSEAGVCVAWRTPEICPVFCDYYNSPGNCSWHYNPCHTPCYKTCLNPEGTCTNPIPELEGCYPVCPEDTPIFDENKQICVEECGGCFYNGKRYNEGDVVFNVTDNLGMCYYGICINSTVKFTNETCSTTTVPPIASTTTPKTTTSTTTHITTTTEPPTTSTRPTTEPTTTTVTPTTTTISTISPTTTPFTTTTPCITTCEWSEWYDVHNPKSDKSDWETYENITNSGKEICNKPKEIDCRYADDPDRDFNDFVSETGQVVTCDVGYGLICRKEDQRARPFKCFNYKIRVCCEVQICGTTTPLTPSAPSTPSTTPPTTTVPITTTKSTTPSTQPPTTTEEPSTTTKSTTPSTEPTTTTEEPTTTTESTTPSTQPPSTTEEPSTTTKSTTPSTQPPTTTEEPSTTTKSTTPSTEPTTTTEEPTTTTESTTPSTQPPTTTEGPTTTTKSTTPSTQPPTTTEEPSTTTKSTTPSTQPPTTTAGPTTTTKSTTPSTQPPTTTAGPTTTTKSTTPSTQPPTTTAGPTTTTKSTTPLTQPPTTTEEPSTTTKSTTPSTQPPTTTAGPTTTTKSTTPSTQPPTTTEGPTTTTESTTSSTTPPTTTAGPTTTTKPTTPSTQPPTTTAGPTTTTKSTTPSTQPPTTTEEPSTTTKSTTPSTQPPTTTQEPSTTTKATTPSTQPPTTPCFCVVNGKHYKPGEVIFYREHLGSGLCLTMICSNTCEIRNKTEICTTPVPTSTPTTTPPGPICPEWGVVQNETFYLCNCTMARCIENNTIEIVPYECPPLENITCTNGKKPVLVYDEHYCCQYYACDCVCEGWGDPHYITFDGLYYSYQGNCSYILMEEISPKYQLKIYIDNVFCDPTEDVSCPRSIIVSYRSQAIRLINHNLNGAVELEALKNEKRLKLPYSQDDIRIMDSGINLVLEIPRLKVVITFGLVGFSVNLPFQYFGKNTQGHCGTCNNNQADDCMLPGGQLVKSCAMMADYWLAKDISPPSCKIPPVLPTKIPEPEPTGTSCTPSDICGLLKSSVFAACHPFVSPDHFYQGCVFDSCHLSNKAVECTSLQTYAAACAQAGVCIHWRNQTTLCASDCPSNKVYMPCGPAEQPTCEDGPNESTLNFTTEGCFCPDGKKLFNKESGICVDKCGCLDSQGIPREFDEKFEHNCQNCICKESTKTVTCKPKVCPVPPAANCTSPGFVLVNQANPSDPCCSVYVCQCQSNTCPVYNMNCPVGHIPVVDVPEGKCCLEHTCEPKRVCVHRETEYQPGSSVPGPICQDCTCTNEVDPKTGLFRIRCEFQQCQVDCELGYEYKEGEADECCGKCVQTHCVFSVNGTNQLLSKGDTWSPPDSKCEQYICVKSGQTLTTIRSHIVCPPFDESNCQPDTIQTAADGCCTTCVEKEKACKLLSMKTIVRQGRCESYEEVEMPYCEGSCNTFTKYSQVAAGMQQYCSCCKETRFSRRSVNLHCPNGDVVPHSYIHVEECGCDQSECTKAAGHLSRRRRSLP